MCNLSCYYAEDRRFDSFFGWLRAAQHCAYKKWLPTCRWPKSSVNLQSYSNLQSQNWTESCEEVQKKIIDSNPNLFKQKRQHPIPSIYWNVASFKSKYMYMSGHFHALGMRKPHFQCNANRDFATTSLVFAMTSTYCTFFLWRLYLAPPSHPGQSTTLLWLERQSNKCAKLHTVAPNNNKDPASCSFYFRLFVPHGCCSSCTSRSWGIAHSTQC